MFETTSRIAEKLATSVSRRGFLDSLGRWAGATALGLAGVLTTAGSARADSYTCCTYFCNDKSTKYKCLQGTVICPTVNNCVPGSAYPVFDCRFCPAKKGSGGGA